MSRVLLIALLAIAVSACGVKRPLIKPQDVQAHEDARARELEKREQERKEEQQQQQLLQPIQRR